MRKKTQAVIPRLYVLTRIVLHIVCGTMFLVRDDSVRGGDDAFADKPDPFDMALMVSIRGSTYGQFRTVAAILHSRRLTG